MATLDGHTRPSRGDHCGGDAAATSLVLLGVAFSAALSSSSGSHSQRLSVPMVRTAEIAGGKTVDLGLPALRAARSRQRSAPWTPPTR